MPIPTIYRSGGDVLVNYDFTDVLSSVGYVTLYSIADNANATTLIRQAIDSNNDDYQVIYAVPGAEAKLGERNFDFNFLTPQYVKGKLYVTTTYAAYRTSGQTISFTKIRILHYDGSDEIVIGTQQTTDNCVSDSATVYCRATCVFAINKKFKKGEILRVEIEDWGSGTAGNHKFFHDGGNKNYGQVYPAGVTIGSNLIVQVPFYLTG